jgi:glycosyltransferase involved in cell wall biosynthesis
MIAVRLMKNILLISGIQLYNPISGGQIRSTNICAVLKKEGHQVSIFSFTGRKKNYLNFFQINRTHSPGYSDKNISEFIDMNPAYGLIQLVFYKLNLPPIWLTLLTYFHIPKKLKRMIDKCDLIIIDFPFLFPITFHTTKKVILNTHNIESDLYQNHLLKWIVQKIEIKSITSTDHVFICSITDLKDFLKIAPNIKTKYSIVPNGVNFEKYTFQVDVRNKVRSSLNLSDEEKIIVFTGSNYEPNKEAYHFLKNWYELNKSELLKLHIVILIVGSVCEKHINEPNFKIIGKVEDVIPYLQASDFGINPVISGSGTNIKMTEYLASKLPIITTEFGARGLILTHLSTCWLFARKNLLSTIKQAISEGYTQNKQMANKALDENYQRVDISSIIHSLNSILS